VSYNGQAYQIPCAAGGNNYSLNTDGIPPEAMVSPSKNLNLHTGGRTKRGGTTHAVAAAITGTPRILAGYDFRLEVGTQKIMAFADDGNLYSDAAASTSIKSGLATSGQPCFETFRNELYVTDGATTPQTWNGVAASTSNLTTPAIDWGAGNQPKYCLAHGAGVSRRMWYFGLTTTPKRAYYSVLDDGKDMTGSGSGQLNIETSDGFGIVGGVEFGQRLIFFSKKKAYVVDDTNSSVANWGYAKAQWEGGVAHHNLIVKTPNDVICMHEDGEIYSVTAVQSYGDYKAASISRPAFIHAYIKENINIALIDQFHAVYDPQLRAIKFFVIRNGMSEIDTALVFFIDRPADQAWQVHDNIDADSGYSASCAFTVRESAGIYTVYTGDYDGWLWKTEQTAKNDNDEDYTCQMRTPPLDFGNGRVRKKYRRGKIIYASPGNYDVNVRWWVDNVEQTPRIVTLNNTGAVYDSAVYDTDAFAQEAVAEAGFDLGAIGKRIQIQLENSTADEDFFVSRIFIDNEVLGARA
jgi:hypothetical protein